MNNLMDKTPSHSRVIPYLTIHYLHEYFIQPLVLAILLVIGGTLVSASTSAADQTDIKKNTRSFDSRNLSFTRISLEQGLSQSTANTIVQDQQGYIWIGTQEGLNRYDGYEVKTFERDYQDPTSLSNNFIWSLRVDNKGILWAGTNGGGLNRYNAKQGTFTQFKHNPEDINSLSHDRVRVIYQDFQGIFWIGTDGGGLNRFDSKTHQFTRYQHDSNDTNSLSNNSVLSILEDRGGNLWIGTNGGGLSMLNRHTGKFTHYQQDKTSATSLSGNRVRSIYEDQKGQLWVGTYEGGINQFNPVTGTFKHFKHDEKNPNSLSNNRVRDIYQDIDGTLWIATDGGLNQWLPDSQNFSHYHHNPADPSSLSDDRIISIFQDRGGVMWVGTYNGLNKWNYVSDAFTYYQKFGSTLNLSSNIVTSVMESNNNNLWVGTYGGGLNLLNRKTGTVKHYHHDKTNSNSLSDDRVMTTFVDSTNIVWIGTRNGGLNRLDLKTESFTHFKHDPNDPFSLSANGVTSILAEPNGMLWVGTYGEGLNVSYLSANLIFPDDSVGGGLSVGNTQNGRFKTFRHNPNDIKSLSSDRVINIYRDHFGTLWIGTDDGGLNRFDETTQTFERFQHYPKDPNSLSSNSIWDITETSNGDFWIATSGGGLNFWSAENRIKGKAIFKHFRKSDGLLSDTIQGVLEDNAGYLWLSSNRGLQRFDPKTGKMRAYDRSNGLKGNEFNTLARFKSQDGRIYFGGTNGVVAFYPHKIRSNKHQPEIILSSHTRLAPLKLHTSDRPKGSSSHEDITLKLSYKEDLITFTYAGLDYTSPEKNQYRYKLEGFDDDWTGPIDFKRTTYTNLPAGNYTFRVMASNNDGVWSEKSSNIKLEITPAPWKTGWAYGLYTLLGLGIFFAFLRAQSNKLKEEIGQRVYLEEQVQLRTHEIAKQNNQLQELNEQLKDVSVTDSLTGLYNRRFMDDFIEAEVAQANRLVKGINKSDGKTSVQNIAPSLSFMMIDLDGFKPINDTYGHHAGDKALVQVRDILQECCRKADTIIRWGGDEFLIVSRNTNRQSAEVLAERIRVALAKHVYQLGNKQTARLSGSIGFALYPFSLQQPDSVPWEQVAAIADRGTYVAKDNGRNAWVGLYGTRNTTLKELSRIKHELDDLVNKEVLQIMTSISGEVKLDDQKATPRK